MHVAPESRRPRVSSASGARCRYVNNVWRGSSIATSTGWGSLTLTIMSEPPNTVAASGTIAAPCSTYSSSGIADPAPAPCWMSTSWPRSTSSRTPAGVIATRYSSVLISVGTPTFMDSPLVDELAAAQRQPELDAVPGAGEVAPRQLFDLADAVAQGVAVAVQPPRGRLPLAVA